MIVGIRSLAMGWTAVVPVIAVVLLAFTWGVACRAGSSPW